MPSVVSLFRQAGAYLDNGHFVYSSGKHGDVYLNKNDIFAYPALTEELSVMAAERFRDLEVDTVAGPAMCGIIPAQRVAHHLSRLQGKDLRFVFAEQEGDGFAFKRGYDRYIRGKRVLIVDDITNSGGTMRKTIALVRELGGTVAAATAYFNRNPAVVSAESLGAAFDPAETAQLQAWNEADCPLCARGVPVNTTVGHGKEFMKHAAGKK